MVLCSPLPARRRTRRVSVGQNTACNRAFNTGACGEGPSCRRKRKRFHRTSRDRVPANECVPTLASRRILLAGPHRYSLERTSNHQEEESLGIRALVQEIGVEEELDLKIILAAAALLTLAVFSGSARSLGAQAEDIARMAHFPPVKASNLEKREFSLPTDFEGDRNLVLVAFERQQQKDVDTWLHEMKGFEDLDPAFRYYELPTIQRPSAFMRWFIDSGMRHGIPDRKARERTITLYLDKKTFCDALLRADQKKFYAFMIDRSGTVMWKVEGDFDAANGESLRDTLMRNRP
jgi:hypothetical protein